MPETESPADRLRRRIAEERNGRFAALEPYREVIQSETEIGTPQRCLIRHLQKENVLVSRYTFAQYLQHIGLGKSRRRKSATPPKPRI
jgi:hypothetical protein